MIGAFRKEIQHLTGRTFSFATRSGTAAIVAALESAGLPKASEVIIPAICCPAVLSAVTIAGLKPVIADVSPDHFGTQAGKVSEQISKDTSAIIAVHAYGSACDISELEAISGKHGLLLIEDACLALGGFSGNQPLGSFGSCSVFSFGHDKIISGGGGGMLVTNESGLARKLTSFFDTNPFFIYADRANNQSHILEQFSLLDANLTARKRNAALYMKEIDRQKVVFGEYSKNCALWRLPGLFKGNRERMIQAAKENGIVITLHYPSLARFRYGEHLPVAGMVDQSVVNFFIRGETSVEHIEKTVDFINHY